MVIFNLALYTANGIIHVLLIQRIYGTLGTVGCSIWKYFLSSPFIHFRLQSVQ